MIHTTQSAEIDSRFTVFGLKSFFPTICRLILRQATLRSRSIFSYDDDLLSAFLLVALKYCCCYCWTLPCCFSWMAIRCFPQFVFFFFHCLSSPTNSSQYPISWIIDDRNCYMEDNNRNCEREFLFQYTPTGRSVDACNTFLRLCMRDALYGTSWQALFFLHCLKCLHSYLDDTS